MAECSAGSEERQPRIMDGVTTDYQVDDPRLAEQTCLIVGGAPSVWEDLQAARKLCPTAKTLAVNAIGMYVPDPLHYWFSLHCDYLMRWEAVRSMGYRSRDEGKYKKPILFALRHDGDWTKKGDIDAVWCFGDPHVKRSAKHSGSLEDSGFFATCIALTMGFGRVWLVGCPADASGHKFIPHWRYLEHDYEAIKGAWQAVIDQYPEFREKVRSCSGLTRELLGQPEGVA